MNSILQKCLDELNQPDPKLDYVRGMLETVLSFSAPTIALTPTTKAPPVLGQSSTPLDEAAILDAQARAGLQNIVQ